MDVKTLRDIAPGEWPAGAGRMFLDILRDERAAEGDRLLAAELAGDFTVINDELVDALLAIMRDGDESAKAARRADTMTRYSIDDGIPTLAVALSEHMNANELKKLASVTGGPVPTRKAELVDLIAKHLEANWLRAGWQSLDELQKAAVVEVVHSGGTQFPADRFHAKYGRAPSWGSLDTYRRERAAHGASLLLLRGAGGGGVMLDDLKEPTASSPRWPDRKWSTAGRSTGSGFRLSCGRSIASSRTAAVRASSSSRTTLSVPQEHGRPGDDRRRRERCHDARCGDRRSRAFVGHRGRVQPLTRAGEAPRMGRAALRHPRIASRNQGDPEGAEELQTHALPEGVARWFNAMDERDVVALYPLDTSRFPLDPATPAIENKIDVRNKTANRHGIAGYLDNKEVARRIYDALVS